MQPKNYEQSKSCLEKQDQVRGDMSNDSWCFSQQDKRIGFQFNSKDTILLVFLPKMLCHTISRDFLLFF